MKLLQAALWFLLAAFLAITAWYIQDTGGNKYIFAFCVVGAIVTGCAGVFTIFDLLKDLKIEYAMGIANAESITPESALAEAISQLNTEQTAILSRQIVGGIAIVNPDARPVFAIRTPGEDCPLEFAAEILSRVDGGRLPAIRDYSDGSHEREWLQGLTALLVHHGWARPAVGNQAAVLTVPVGEVAYHLGVEG